MARRIRNKRRHNIQNQKIKIVVIPVIIAILCVLFFSVIFSIAHIGNSKIIKGVKIGNIDVSNLSQDEAKAKIDEWYQNLVDSNIILKFNNMEGNIKIEDLKPEINTDKLVNKALLVGKSGNIIKDNYKILYTLIFGEKIENEITFDEEVINKKIEEMNKGLPNALEKSDYYIDENNLIIKKGKAGIEVNKEVLKNIIKNSVYDEKREYIISVINSTPEIIDIEKIHKEIYKEEKNAYITQNPVEIHPEINGVDFAISIEEAKKILEEEKDEYIIPLTIKIPETTLDKLGKEAFPSKLGSFMTRYDASNINRSTNLELASNKINGTIVLPGEKFSYNKIVGERTIEQGYKEATVYSNGKVVDGIGGGICQLSSTLYNAVLYANLEITDRSNHRFLTSYVTAGRDATVSWGTIDFCFKNTRKYPIKIVSSVKNGVANVEIYGMKEDKEYEIVIESNVVETIPYKTNYVIDNTLEKGRNEIKQKGINGAKSETYKIVKYNGIVVSRTLISKDTYSALERIIKTASKEEKQEQETNAGTTDKDEGMTINKDQLKDLNPELLETLKELE